MTESNFRSKLESSWETEILAYSLWHSSSHRSRKSSSSKWLLPNNTYLNKFISLYSLLGLTYSISAKNEETPPSHKGFEKDWKNPHLSSPIPL